MNGQDIKTIRQELGLSQQDLAQKIGVKRLAIARWESGTRTPEKANQKRLWQFVQANGLETKLENVSSNDESVSTKLDTLDTTSDNVSKLDTKLDTLDTKKVSKLDTTSENVSSNDENVSTKLDTLDTKRETNSDNVSKQLDTTFPTGYNFDNIPSELIGYPHWVCWGVIERDGKKTKVPYSPHGGKAKTNDSATWGTFEQAQAYLEQNQHLAGIGFVFSDDDPFCGVDFDNCRKPQTGEIDEWALKWIEKFNSYTEVSPSYKGAHVIIEGKKKGDKCRKDNIEIYDTERFFTITGNVLDGYREIYDNQKVLNNLYDVVFTEQNKKQSKPKVDISLDDQTLIEKAMNAKDGAKFTTLWEGDISSYHSHSEGDFPTAARREVLGK